MRERLFTLIEKAPPGDRLSKLYDMFIVVVAFISVTPLMFKTGTPFLQAVDLVTVYILFADYIFRWLSCDLREQKPGQKLLAFLGVKEKPWMNFVLYPFTPAALLVLISLLPSLGLLGRGFRIIRVLRITIVFRYSENFRYVARVFQKEKKTLCSVLYIAVFYIFLSALLMFAYEPDTFDNFFEATYWATTALTTVGYGDVFPVSAVGKLISMVSSLFGIAIIALPAGIVTAGFVDEISKGTERKQQAAQEKAEHARLAAGKPLVRVTPLVKHYALVMGLGLLLNIVLGQLIKVLNLPLWLDVTGTALTALLLDPAAALLVGLATNLFTAVITFTPGALIYFTTSAMVAILVSAYLKKGGVLQKRRIVPCVLLVALFSTLLTAGTDLWITMGGAPLNYWEHFFYEAATSMGLPYLAAFFGAHLIVQSIDAVCVAALVALLYTLWPKTQK